MQREGITVRSGILGDTSPNKGLSAPFSRTKLTSSTPVTIDTNPGNGAGKVDDADALVGRD
ncbi:hypothetical protein ACQEVF_14735 [Nonomuraea polychroma]|uniref:hypothetical protein n=1 Tax=Nonomuraea polychroma TaxID=46176 RepID=UPI003D90EA8F